MFPAPYQGSDPRQNWRGSQPDGQARPTYQKATFGFYQVQWVTPAEGFGITPVLTLSVTVLPTSADGSLMTVQVETALDQSFTSSLTTTTVGSLPSGTPTTISGLGPFVDGTTRYLRVRAGDGSSLWSEWVAARTIQFNTGVGDGVAYIYENVGAILAVNQDTVAYVYENVGLLPTYDSGAVAYIYEGDVNNDTPTPHIWFIKPNSGRSGDGFVIYGQGFGSPQSQYNGLLQFLEGAVWTVVGVAQWTLIAADANAYTAARTIDESIPLVDPEHNEVQVTIPNGLVPPGYLLRIETNGP